MPRRGNLDTKTIEAGTLPPIDGRFRPALRDDPELPDEWSELLRSSAASLLACKRSAMVIGLAWQCQQAGDPTLAKTYSLINQLITSSGGTPGFSRRAATGLVRAIYSACSSSSW